MTTDVKVPGFPESVTDGTVLEWHKQPGDTVQTDDILVDIETDKVVFEVPAPASGVMQKILAETGSTVLSGQALTTIKEGAATLAPQSTKPTETRDKSKETVPEKAEVFITPSARRMIAEKGLDSQKITGSGKAGRILKEDVLYFLEQAEPVTPTPSSQASSSPSAGAESEITTAGMHVGSDGRAEERVPMTRLRAKVAERLVEAQHNAALLSTFNEVNMQPVMDLRAHYREEFEKEYGVRLGLMSFFVKAAVEALKKFPEFNASIDGTDIVYHGFYDVGIAVSSPRGLVVPVLRNADQLSMDEIEKQIIDFAKKAQNKSLAIDDITGGTFTITNGGVFGSLLSTPIINPPQSAILGMHKTQPRPMAVDGEVVILPMMYLALTYDHRIIDGREAVQFLTTIKEQLEDPARMLLQI